MDISSYFVVAAAVSVVFLSYFYYCYRIIHGDTGNDKGRRFAPQPSGALPIIGHLHLLTMGSKPGVAPALAAMADKYGPVLTVWLGMQRVFVVSDPKVAKECFTTHDRALSSRPRTSSGKFLLFDYAAFGVSPYGAYWRSIRKFAVTHLLSSDGLRATEHVRLAEVDSLVRHLSSLNNNDNNDQGTVVTMSAMFECFILNVTTRIMAGKKSHVFDDSQEENVETKRIGRMIKEFMKLAGLPVVSDLIPLLSWTSGFCHGTRVPKSRAAS